MTAGMVRSARCVGMLYWQAHKGGAFFEMAVMGLVVYPSVYY